MYDKKILVLGKYKRGFITSNIIEFLKIKNYNVFWDNDTDLRKIEEAKKLFIKIKPDIVIHAAAYTSGILDILEKPWYHINDNALMNSNVLQLCHLNNVEHFIFLSCCVMYNREKRVKNFPPLSEYLFTEESTIHAESIKTEYLGVASMKLFTENLCLFYSKKYGMKTTVIRHTNTYGPYDHFKKENNHVIPAIINRIGEAQDKIEIWGNPNNRKNLIYVKDVCRFIEYVINNQKINFEIFNLGGQDTSIINLVKLILLISGKKLEIITDKEKLKNLNQLQSFISFKKAKTFGFDNNYTLFSGLKETWNWFLSNS